MRRLRLLFGMLDLVSLVVCFPICLDYLSIVTICIQGRRAVKKYMK